MTDVPAHDPFTEVTSTGLPSAGAAPSTDVGRLDRIKDRITAAADAAGRSGEHVRLLLAVKTQPADRIATLLRAGHDLIGHNRVQEMATLEADLTDIPHEVHMIGQLQSNKVNAALRWATCIQGVDSTRLADRLNRSVQASERQVEVFVQVNVSAEDTKGGVAPSQAAELCAHVGALPHLRLRGLMTIGANSPVEKVVRAGYADLAKVRDAVVGSNDPGTAQASELSMGMSADLEWAIAEGATMVRVGTGVFGERTA